MLVNTKNIFYCLKTVPSITVLITYISYQILWSRAIIMFSHSQLRNTGYVFDKEWVQAEFTNTVITLGNYVCFSLCPSVCAVSIAAAPGSKLASCQLHSQARIFSVPDSLTAASQCWMLRNRENVHRSGGYSRCYFATQALLYNRLTLLRWLFMKSFVSCMLHGGIFRVYVLRFQRFNHSFIRRYNKNWFGN